MDSKKLERWAQLLLDTGKRNNLINFKDTKASTAEIVYPDAESFYEKCLSISSFEIYDPKIEDDEEDDDGSEDDSAPEITENNVTSRNKKTDYVDSYSGKIRKNNQVLVYAQTPNPITAIRNIDKKARDFLEETGVNVAYLAFGFVHWKENENSAIENRAPLLLVPITLKNESLIKPYIIELTGDDVVVNPTFKYLLEAQYGVKLPEYEQDEKLKDYLDSTQAIVSKLHWTISSECKLGIFSFLKINMYHDLMNNSDVILQNENVRRLMGETYEVDETEEFEERQEINELIDLHTVVDADSSQIEAIEMVKSGKSFVLQGPPGTGKSQTITNVIAECLYDGKKVLFVSEKQAALNVVYDKLKKAGLDEFCLELHSYKANKKEVISELCKTLKADRSIVSSKANDEVQEKAQLQEQLDSYAEALHKPIPKLNKSLYQTYESASAFRKAPKVDYILSDIEKKGEKYLSKAINLLGQYEDYVPTIGDDYKKNEWYGFCKQKITYEDQNKLRQDLQNLADGLDDLMQKADSCKSEYSIELDTLLGVEKTIHLLNILADSDYLRPEVLQNNKSRQASNVVAVLSELSARMIPICQGLNEHYENGVYQIDGQDYYNKFTKLYSGVFTRLVNAEYKDMIKSLRLASKTGKKPAYAEAVDHVKTLMDYQALEKEFEKERQNLDGLLKLDNVNVDTNWTQLHSELDCIEECFGDGRSSGQLGKMSVETFDSAKGNFKKHADAMADSIKSFTQPLADLRGEFDPKQMPMDGMALPMLRDKMLGCAQSMEKLENWMRFYVLFMQLEKEDLLSFIDCAINQGIPGDQYVNSYQKLYYGQWINHVIYDNPVLFNFTRISQDKAVERFARKDKLQFDISKAQIRALLSSKRPSLDMMAGGSAVSILLREGEKKRKQKSIRKLLEETGSLVQLIKPCFLMSPLSVSTFLSANAISFDTVVFDEASQIFPQDAIGAIYRGKQLIVVGDSKQMPPSNFFNSSVEMDDDDEEAGDVTDFESILDLCATSLPQLRLKWHYRSRYEQLISFSNKNFYDNTLVSFPSSTMDKKGIGVDYYHVDGIFDRKSHTNRKEAEFIVDLIFDNIEQYPQRSLGVVAFSVAQQDLIERLLSKRRQEDTSKEWFFKYDETVQEPFFVKNLETVQGDERDTIIFSVAYGMDSQGRLLHNFGPLNRVGGERRLNVAVTRAKDNVQLVASIHGTDIDLKRTSAEGARLLREYLDYAENGDVALERSISVNPFEQYDSEFEMEVCEFLREKGFTVDTQIGCSGYKIDLGIRKPDSSDYVLAVECDGATYHSSKNARDRDRLRQEILERMGWRFYRIWSTDWFRNNTIEKERLFVAATEAVNLGHFTQPVEKQEKEPEPADFEKTVESPHLSFPLYQEADIYDLWHKYRPNVQGYVRSILEVEAPVSEEYLLKRICFCYDRDKVTSVVRDEFERNMRGCSRNGIIRHKGFLYRAEQNTYVLRVPGVKRDIKYIAPEELAAGFYVLVKQNMTVDKDGLFRSLANQLGFTRLGEAIYSKLEKALELVPDISVNDNVITWVGTED